MFKNGQNIQLHKNDLPDDLNLGNIIAVDGEFMDLMSGVTLYVCYKYPQVI